MLSINNVVLNIIVISIYWVRVSGDSTVPLLNSTKFYQVTSILAEPFLMVKEEGWEGKETEYEGFIPDLLHQLGEHIGVHFKYSLAKDGKIGNKLKDGTWTGIMGELTRKETDLGAGPITITSMRGRVIDFSKPFMATGTTVVLDAAPDKDTGLSSGQKVMLVLCPFTAYAWMLIIMACVLILLFVLMLHRVLPNHGEKQLNNSYMASTLNSLTSLRVGGQWSTCAFRFTCGSFVLLTLILYTAGAVSLLLHLNKTKYHAPPVTKTRTLEHLDLDDIFKSNLYTIAVVKDGSTASFLRTSSIRLYNALYEKVHYVDSIADGFELLSKDPSMAFMTDAALAEYHMMRKPFCQLEKIGSLTSIGYGLALPLGSELYHVINLAIMELRETGILQALQKKWWHDRTNCEQPLLPAQAHKLNKKAAPAKVDGPSIGGVLIILAIGLCLTLVMAIIERRLTSNKVNIGRKNLRDLDDQLLHTGGARGVTDVPLA